MTDDVLLPLVVPCALVPRPQEGPLVVRAERALRALAPYADGSRLDTRFRLALEHLVLSLRGLEGLRALAVAPEAVEPAIAEMQRLLGAFEPAVEHTVKELEREGESKRAAPRTRSPRRSRAVSAA